MLSAEEARARLHDLCDDDWRRGADRRIKKLDRRLRPLARALVDDSGEGAVRVVPADHGKRLAAAAPLIDQLDVDQRTRLFEALHPQIGGAMARLWVDLRRQPYRSGVTRKAFRAPNDPQLTAQQRARHLFSLVHHLGPYPHDVTWLAVWAGHLPGPFPHTDPPNVGSLLAAAIDMGGDSGEQVFDHLVLTGNGEHPIGVFGRHVTGALLCASRPDGWEFVERLLLAAQRQEGLRQSILESADFGHPDAFRRLLDLVLEHDLLRFAASVRAAAVWLGMPADVEQIPELTERVRLLRDVFTDQETCRRALETGSAWETYVALCAVAMHDVTTALRWVPTVSQRPDRDARAALVRFLAATELDLGRDWNVHLTGDDDPSVAVLAAEQIPAVLYLGGDPVPNAFDALTALAARLPDRPRQGEWVGIETDTVTLDRGPVVTRMLAQLGDRPIESMLPWLPHMDAVTREALASRIGRRRHLTPELRDVVFQLLADRSSRVRDEAASAAAKLELDSGEAAHVEALLTRRASDTRRTAIVLLSNQSPAATAASAERLWATGNEAQRDAASELLSGLPPKLRSDLAARFARDGASDRQQELHAPAEPTATRTATASDASHPPLPDAPGIGLYDPGRRAPVPAPQRRDLATIRGTDTILKMLSDLDDLAHEHRDTAVIVSNWQRAEEKLLGDVQWFPSPFAYRPPDADDDAGRGLVLPEVFRRWWSERPADRRGVAAIEAVQALTALRLHADRAWRPQGRALEVRSWECTIVAGSPGELRHRNLVAHVVEWMLVEHADESTVDHCLDALETLFATIPRTLLRGTPDEPKWDDPNRIYARHHGDWRTMAMRPWHQVLLSLLARFPERISEGQLARWYRLERWFDEPRPGCAREPVDQRLVLEAHRVGAATDDDVRDTMIQPRTRLLYEATRHRRSKFVEHHPRVAELADELRDRIVDVERRRGELPTAATPLASRLASVHGVDIATELLSRLGRSTLVRGWKGGDGRDSVFSRLLQRSYPADDDTPESLRTAAEQTKVTDRRLIELAMYAPQWADLVEATIGWDGLTEAVWWFHAHTKDTGWSVDPDVRTLWSTLAAERTPLGAEDLLEGAVDVEWFRRAQEALGDDRWAKVHKVAKLASGGSGHRRAQVFAEALTGAIDEATLVARITDKRNQDAVRALGLLPLPDDADERLATMLRRYGRLRDFERGSAKFGNQRKASERLAVRIGIENLARTAGFVDPQRFIWSAEAAEAGELADGPVAVVEGEVTVTLAVDAEGVAGIAVEKAGTRLKNVPAALRKHGAIKELRDRKTALTRQATRVRRALDEAMVRQETFELDDLRQLDRHPVLAPMLRLVTWVDTDGRIVRRDGDRFADADDATTVPTGAIRLAHPLDLLAGGEWVAWQEQLFTDATRQPFKQVFRELYVPTEAEMATSPITRRYEGHQLQPRQAMALFGNRGWVSDREVGDVWRVFHQHGVTARVEFLEGFLTPAEVELPTVQAVYFTAKADYQAMPLDSVPPIVFSETMRDLDLVVSVAHAGGVDPEASASTVEMRAALARETARLAKLDNVRVDDHHVLVDGTLGEYSIHLGSGVVHRRPGGAVCIIPVASQRRGRLFLPFADDDPKTAEVMSKILLLANDKQIKDPSILSQLR